MFRSLALAIVPVAVATAPVAEARPSVTVVGDAPFSERELGDAVELRSPRDVAVEVRGDDGGRLIVEVGGHAQVVELGTRDPQAAARVVAMVVVALADQGSVAAPSDTPALAPPAVVASQPAPHAPSRLSLRLVPTLVHDDGGYTNPVLTGSLGYELTPYTKLVATAGIGRIKDNASTDIAVPLRLGLEGSAGALGIELGGYATPFTHASCEIGRPGGMTAGAYGAARLYVPVSATARVVVEGGGEYVLATRQDDRCQGPLAWEGYAGWLGAGGEWAF